MSEQQIHVIASGDGWTFREPGGEPQGEFSSAAEAEVAAKEAAHRLGGLEVVVHDREGHVNDSDSLDEASTSGLG